jgi:AraC-like DNA-binding protein
MQLTTDKNRNPLLLVSGRESRVESALAERMRIYRFDLPGQGGFCLAGDQEPAYMLVWLTEGSAEVEGGSHHWRVELGRPLLRVYRNAFRARPLGDARGVLILIPARALRLPAGPVAEWTLRWKGRSLETRMVRDCLDTLAGDWSASETGQTDRAAKILLMLLPESLEAERPDPGSAEAPWYVTATERFLAERLDSPLCIRSLAQASGISARTLHEGFRRYRGCTPMQFLRQRRMEAVRDALLHPNPTTSVTDTALRCGFTHLGRFSSYYERIFGELPSETLSLARARRQSRPAGMSASAGSLSLSATAVG